jgi:hypothetical protein
VNAKVEAATAERQDTSSDSGVVFVAKAHNHRVVLEPTRNVIAQNTGDVVTRKGKTVEFKNGIYRTDDSEEAKALRESSSFGIYFFEKEEAPPAPGDAIKAVTRAAANRDADKLREIIVTERNGHSRPEVLEVARTALDEMDEDGPEEEIRPEFNVPRIRNVPATGAAVPPLDYPIPPHQRTDGNVGHIGLTNDQGEQLDHVERDEEQQAPDEVAKDREDGPVALPDDRPVPGIHTRGDEIGTSGPASEAVNDPESDEDSKDDE